MTKQEYYEKFIPKCYVKRTMDEHFDMMLCWSLVRHIEDGEQLDCSKCYLNVNFKEE